MSVATSQENIPNSLPQNYDGSSNMCLELALEGERLCKSGDCRAGVAFFQAAIQAGTDDLRTLSAIYSQLGNAYFYLGDFNKAMQYHRHDLTLARTMGDKLGEAKSSGNLGNTLKVMGKFDEAILCCKRHLELARELEDQLSEGRALYNLGNVYHAKGKQIGMVGQKNPGELSDEVKECLQEAVKYYEENLGLMRGIGDVAAQGRACGNLGNTYYLLGDFSKAINYHEERLAIARQFGDKPAERRAHSNLGNSNIFMGQFEEAAHHYRRTLALAQELGDQAIEAQACYSLGNTYTLLRDFETAIEYHLRHLLIAQNLNDRVGEGRACWSLGNAHASLGNHDKALNFATKHLEISKELKDPMSETTARMNVADLRRILSLPDEDDHTDGNSSDKDETNNDVEAVQPMTPLSHNNRAADPQHLLRVRRESMEQLSLIKLTPDNKHPGGIALPQKKTKKEDDDLFFDLLSRFQSKRMDDQRCTLTLKAAASGGSTANKENKFSNKNDIPEDLFDMITGMQSKRMDEQRVELPALPGLQTTGSIPDDHFLDQLVRCQNSRLDDQRSPLPSAAAVLDIEGESSSAAAGATAQQQGSNKNARTVPDDDLFSLIMRFQSGRMDDQRATIVPAFNRIANGALPNPSGSSSTSSSINGLNNTKKPSKRK